MIRLRTISGEKTYELKIEYAAETDRPTFVNLTHHSYFNLKDGGGSDILGHELMIKASKVNTRRTKV